MTVTVRELIRRLEGCDPEAEVSSWGHCCGGDAELLVDKSVVLRQVEMSNHAEIVEAEHAAA